MGWQDDPVVSSATWQDDPVVGDWQSDPVTMPAGPAEQTLPQNWVGRPLSTPIESLEGGQRYLDLVDKNARGRRGFFEELRPEVSELPWVGPWAEIPSLIGITRTAKKLQNNEDVTDEQLLKLNHYLEYRRRKELASPAAKTLDVIQTSLAYGVEIASTFVLSGLLAPEPVTTALGAGVAAKTAGRVAATKAARKATQKFMQRALGKTASKYIGKGMKAAVRSYAMHKGLGQAIQATTTRAISKRFGPTVARYLGKIAGVGVELESMALVNQLLNPQRTIRTVAERRLTNALRSGDESVAASVAKGFADMNFEYASEFSGAYLGAAAAKLLPKKMVKALGQSAIFNFLAMRAGSTKSKAVVGAFKTMGIHGMAEEMLEERAGDFMRGLFGVRGKGGLTNAIKEAWPSGEQFMIEAVAFSVLPLMASSISRITGGVTAGEYAGNLDALKSVGKAEPGVYAKTEKELRAEAEILHGKLVEENTPWYVDTQFDFLKKIFGEERRGTVQSMLTRKGVGNLRKIHDLAVKADPANPNAGTDAVAGFLSMLQRVQMTGIETKADADLFNAGVKSGDIIRKQRGDAVRFFASRDALSKGEYNKLVKQTGIRTVTEIGNVETERIGELSAIDFAKSWAELTPLEQSAFSKRWHSKDMAHLEEKYNFLRGVLTSGQLDVEMHETLPFVAVGTAGEFSARGYEIDNLTDVYDVVEGKKRYAMDLAVMSSPDGTEVDVSTHAPAWAITEDVIESKLKQYDPNLDLFDAANSWMNDIQKDIKAKGKKASQAEQRINKLLSSKTGRFEFLVKTYYLNRMGYDVAADRYAKLLTSYAVPDNVHSQMLSLVGEDLLNAMSKIEIKAPVRGERHERVREIMEKRPAGGMAEARKLVAEGQTDALVNQLGTALGKDMRTVENRQAVQDILTDMDREGVTFALASTFGADNEFADLKRAVETGEWRDIMRASKHFWVKVPGRPSARREPREEPRRISPVPRPAEAAETRIETGMSLRREREAPYPEVEFGKAAYSAEELESVAPDWLTGAALEEWINNFDEVNSEDIARQAKEQNPELKRSIEDMVADLDRAPWQLQQTLARYRRPGARTVTMPERRVRGGKVVPAVPTVSGAPFAVESKTAKFDLGEQEFQGEESEDQALDSIFGEESTPAEKTAQKKQLAQTQKVLRKVQGRMPRASWDMKDLNPDRPIGEQVQSVTVVGMHDMKRFGNALKDMLKGAKLQDFAYLPKGVPVNRLMGWVSQQTKSGRSVVTLRSQNALFDEKADVEGWIAVLDWDLEERLAMPVQRLIFTAHTGYIPQGRIYRSWQYRETGPGQYEALAVIDSDEITSQIEEPIGKPIDFIHPVRGTPDAFRAAVFPMVSNQTLARIAEAEGADKRELVDMLAFNLHDWIRRNRIRKLGIIGLPSTEIEGTRDWTIAKPFTSGNIAFQEGDTITYPAERVVPAKWIPALSQVVSRAMGPEIMKAERREGMPPAEAAIPAKITPEMKTELEAEMRMGGTFALTSPSGERDARAQQVAEELGVKYEGIQESHDFPRIPEFWVFTDTIPGQESTFFVERNAPEEGIAKKLEKVRATFKETTEPTFSLTSRYITSRILYRYNNNVSDTDMQTINDAVLGMYQGDPKALGQVSRMLLPQDWGRMQAGLTAINERVRAAEVPELAEAMPELPSYEEELNTTALGAIENLYEDLDPAFRGGAMGFHQLMLDQGRKLRAIKYEETVFVDTLNRKLGLEGRRKDLPENHREVAENMLSAVGAMLDKSKRIPVRRGAGGEIQYHDPQTFIAAWDAHVAEHNLDMPKAQELLDQIRSKFNAARKTANAVMDSFTDEEWIRYLSDYVNHQYRTRSRQQTDEAVRRMVEEAREAKERRLPTYEEAAEKRDLFPVTMNALDLYRMWNNTVWAAARNKSMVSIASTVRDADGAPIVIPVKMGRAVEGEDQLIDNKTLRETLKHLAAYLEQDYDQSADPAAEIHRLVGDMNVEESDYVRMDSPLTKSVDFFLVRKGVTHDIMKNVLHYGRIDNSVMRGIERFNAWSKFMMLSFSGFHPFALSESLASVFGIQLGNPAFHIPSTYKKLKAIVRDMREHPEKYKAWYEAGYTGDVGNPDVRLGLIEQDLQHALNRLEEKGGYIEKILKPGIKGMQAYKQWLDKWLWHQYMPAIKMHSSEFVLNEWRKDNPDADEEDTMTARKQIAEYINPAFGGLEWDQFTWATPQARQWLHALIFAPDWSLSAAQISGLTRIPLLNKMHATKLSPLMKDQMLRKYWPAMTSIVLLGLPNLVQLAVYAVAGDPDEGDQPFTFLNEPGRRGHIDFTPIFRHLPGYQGDISGKRRVYMRWGKQAYEIFEGWLGDPRMLLRKSSSAVREAFEQVTGTSTTGWELPFKDEGWLGVLTADGSVWKGRLGYTAQKFLPISLTSLAQGKPTAFIAPTAKGVSEGGVVFSMRKALEAYVDKSVLPKELQPVDLSIIVSELIDAAQRNGINPELAFNRAKGAVASKYYRRFFEALNEGDTAAMEDAAEDVIALGRGLKGFHDSIERRLEAVSQVYTLDLQEQVTEAFNRAKGR